ncbi:Clathrin light chain-like isoform X1 [Aphelenchoides fujianensis]|nr:Clathrin light chain-like isoform X1 [Aphelenchoides fujianensis]
MSDPVAEFLAREDGAFEDLGDEIVPAAAPAAPAEQQQQQPAAVENGDFGADLAGFQNGIHGGGDSGVDLGALDNPRETPRDTPPVSNGRPSPTISMRSNTVREEPETIKKWRQDHEKLLKEKDEAEAKQKKEMEESARKELEAWKEKRRSEVAERKKQNREIEKKLQQEAKAAEKTGGDSWTEVAKLVDGVNPKVAAKNAAVDTSRMKQLILERKEQTA